MLKKIIKAYYSFRLKIAMKSFTKNADTINMCIRSIGFSRAESRRIYKKFGKSMKNISLYLSAAKEVLK